MNDAEPLSVGVIGVGSMGAHHVRVLHQLSGAELCGVADADYERANTVAAEHDTEHVSQRELWETADAAIIAVPTEAHFDVAQAGLEAGVDLLVEKPFVADPAAGRTLQRLADARDRVLQVGFVERFNPAVGTLIDLVEPSDIVAVTAERLGPPVDRGGSDDVVMDLMIHDIDILRALMGRSPDAVSGARRDSTYASAILEFGDDTVATLTASRVTQRKVRRLAVTCPDRHLVVDYIDQSLRIHRRSRPAYLGEDADVRYRHESIIERPLIESGEPLQRELSTFVEAVRGEAEPVVTAADGLEALDVARSIQSTRPERGMEVSPS